MKKVGLLLLLFSFQLFAQNLISVGGSAVTQNFDAIGTSATATLPSNWKVDKTAATVRTLGTYTAAVSTTDYNAGNSMTSSASGGIFNLGAGVAGSATDRAIGWISTSGKVLTGNLYTWLQNNASTNITSLTISYNVEKYRLGTNSAGFSIQMYYSTDGGAWTSAGSDFLTTFAGGDASNTGYPTAPGVTIAVSSKTLSSLSVANGGNLYLAWSYSVTSGTTITNAQCLGIDDISITANGSSSPTQFVITSISPTFPTAGSGFSVTVQSWNGSNVQSNVSGNTSFTLSTNGNGGTLSGTTSGTITDGTSSVTISGVLLSAAGSNVTLTATYSTSAGASLSAGTSSAFTVLSAADHLSFFNFPSTGGATQNISTFTVEALRSDGSVDQTYSSNIVLLKATGSGNVTGTLSVTPSSGIATFSAVQFDAVDSYTLSANSGSLTQGTSGSISITIPSSATDYFRSKTSGNWNATSTWESSSDNSNWITATLTPDYNANTISILNGHTVIVTTGVTVDQVVVNSGGQITVNSGVTLTIADGSGTDLSVSGIVNNAGTITPTGTIAFLSGGKYQHNWTTGAGVIPTATWDNNSTCEIIGYTTNTSNPSGISQSFGNFTWNCASQASAFSAAGSLTTVNGNLTISSSGTKDFRLCASTSPTLNI
jgi:hypothetical protein